MKKRYTEKDESGEWMTLAEYSRALKEDFDIDVTEPSLRTAAKAGKITGDIRKSGISTLYNYTHSFEYLIEKSPRLTLPDDIRVRIGAFKKVHGIGANEALDKKIEEETTLINERTKNEKIKAEKAQLELDIMHGKYIEVEEASEILKTIAIEFRQSVKGIIPRCSKIIAAETDPHRVSEILKEEISVALDRLNTLDEVIDRARDLNAY